MLPAASPIQGVQQLLQHLSATSRNAHLVSFSSASSIAQSHERFPTPSIGNFSVVTSPLQKTDGQDEIDVGERDGGLVLEILGEAETLSLLLGIDDNASVQQLLQQFAATSGILQRDSLRFGLRIAHAHERSPTPSMGNFPAVTSSQSNGHDCANDGSILGIRDESPLLGSNDGVEVNSFVGGFVAIPINVLGRRVGGSEYFLLLGIDDGYFDGTLLGAKLGPTDGKTEGRGVVVSSGATVGCEDDVTLGIELIIVLGDPDGISVNN